MLKCNYAYTRRTCHWNIEQLEVFSLMFLSECSMNIVTADDNLYFNNGGNDQLHRLGGGRGGGVAQLKRMTFKKLVGLKFNKDDRWPYIKRNNHCTLTPFLKRIGGYTKFLLWTLQLININLNCFLFPILPYQIYNIMTSCRSEKLVISSVLCDICVNLL